MTDMTTTPHSVEYKCPHEGSRCKLGKHCHVLETADRLPCRITAFVKCPIYKKKVPVEIGAPPNKIGVTHRQAA